VIDSRYQPSPRLLTCPQCGIDAERRIHVKMRYPEAPTTTNTAMTPDNPRLARTPLMKTPA
jgi:hypothetical protein